MLHYTYDASMEETLHQPRFDEKMLHCKPTQIELTSADINELDDRMATRRRASSDVTKGKARLSTGPRLPTIIAAPHAEDTITAHHATTSTLHSPTRQCEETTKQPHLAIPAREASALMLRPHLQHPSHIAPVSDAEPVKVDSPSSSPSPPSKLSLPRLDNAWDKRFRHRRRQTSPSHAAVGLYDGAHESSDVQLLKSQPMATYSAPSHAGREVFRELPGGEGVSAPYPSIPRRSPGLRTHPIKPRSQEDFPQVQVDPLVHPLGRDTSQSPGRARRQRDVPEVHIAQDLDPAAAVFTPRVRFMSTTIVPDPGSAGTEVPDISSLRLRTPSEQNVNTSNERREQANTSSQETRPGRQRSNAISSRSRRSSENSALPLPNLERYPLLLPNARSAFERDRREASVSAATVPQVPSASPPSQERIDSISSTSGGSSSRIPSIVSAASGISALSISGDASAEFLRFRSSPLDGLTAELSRLSTALGPTTKPKDRRVSLLNGNPFDSSNTTNVESEPELPYGSPFTSKDVVSPRLLASPSHLTLPKPPVLPNTPLPQSQLSPSQTERLHRHDITRPDNASIATATPAPLKTTTATPKLPVYNDATPARFQPQTPADLTRPSRRFRNRSDSSAHREAFCVGQVLVAPRPAIPERRFYRNTYPTNNPGSNVHPATGNTESHRQGGDTAEHEAEAQLLGTASERAVWRQRRLGGSLDVTPPGHGRFERFLH